MKILGIDYGRKKVGVAVSEGRLAEPWKVIRVNNFEEAIRKVLQVLQVLQVEKVIVGVSEGEMVTEQKEFGENLQKYLKIPVLFQDETLSTYEAKKLSISAGMKRIKRKEMEDAFAAAIMLQSYLDQYV